VSEGIIKTGPQPPNAEVILNIMWHLLVAHSVENNANHGITTMQKHTAGKTEQPRWKCYMLRCSHNITAAYDSFYYAGAGTMVSHSRYRCWFPYVTPSQQQLAWVSAVRQIRASRHSSRGDRQI